MIKRVVLIGGSGFVGTRLVKVLRDAGHRVLIGDIRKSDSYPEIWNHCDVRDTSSLAAVCAGSDVIINLAAEHRDDVRPLTLYEAVNVQGARNVCDAARQLGVQEIVFTSSVAVYGFSGVELDETGLLRPFNEYGKTKAAAEEHYRKWVGESGDRKLVVVRPTVIFGEGNRGNFYVLARAISSKQFLMIGDGTNRKSMAYVGNVAAFLSFVLTLPLGEHLFNYVDKPDYDMNTLVGIVRGIFGKVSKPALRLPYAAGLASGYACDVIASVTRRRLPISATRIQKFCENTVFGAERARAAGFTPPYNVGRAVEQTLRAEFDPRPERRVAVASAASVNNHRTNSSEANA
jgi:GlcNAc-P-P-Und epimerase